MTNPHTLLDSVVTFLQGIPALVALCGDTGNIVAYKHQWSGQTSWQSALRQQKVGTVLVLYRGTSLGRWGGYDSLQHNFSLMIRDAEGVDIAAMWTALINGGFRSAANVHADVEMVKDPTFELQTTIVIETLIDYWSAPFALTEKFPY